MTMFFWLLVGHAVCDYPLQGDFLAKGKNHTAPFPGIPFWQCLFWHAMIHGGAVAMITGNVFLGMAEVVCHVIIDYCKCDGRIGFDMDQAAHVYCKIAWGLLAAFHK